MAAGRQTVPNFRNTCRRRFGFSWVSQSFQRL